MLLGTNLREIMLRKSPIPCYWNGRKGNPCYKDFKTLIELCFSVLWKVELASGYMYLVEATIFLNQSSREWLGFS